MHPQLDFIFSRRSVRKYLAREIPAEMLNDPLEAGMATPAALVVCDDMHREAWQ